MRDASSTAEQWDTLIKTLEDARQLARHLADGTTSFHIECALDEVRSRFGPHNKNDCQFVRGL